MFNRRDIVYLHDGTMEGFFTAVFYAFKNKENPRIQSSNSNIQQIIGADYKYIETEPDKFKRVYTTIIKKTNKDTMHYIHTAFLTADPDKDNVILEFIKLCLEHGPKVNQMLSTPCVITLQKLSMYTLNEYQRLRGFLRFSEISNDIFFGKISPVNNVLPLLAPHFANRFRNQMFVIHDTTYKICAVYNKYDWIITDVVPNHPPKMSENELEYQRLWKEFFKTIEIKERKNPKLQRQMAPKRYWGNMLEMN